MSIEITSVFVLGCVYGLVEAVKQLQPDLNRWIKFAIAMGSSVLLLGGFQLVNAPEITVKVGFEALIYGIGGGLMVSGFYNVMKDAGEGLRAWRSTRLEKYLPPE
jgi:hypothetical protein